MIRRTFLHIASVFGMGTSCQSSAKANEMQTFVLVPGTWHGGWVWKKVKQYLQEKGHTAYTPTPTGVGERIHLLTEDVDLYTHIEDVVNVIKFEELENVILVGHSFSGLTITGIVDRLQDKIKHIIFFDALVPRKGVMKAWPDSGSTKFEEYEARKTRFVDGYKMDMFKEYSIDMLLPEEYIEERDRLKRLITYHPYKQWSTELVLENGGYDNTPKSYIRCGGQKHRASSDWMPGPAKNNPEWNWRELDIPRDGMLTHPQIVGNCFLDLIKLS